jgi:hypothetical protein
MHEVSENFASLSSILRYIFLTMLDKINYHFLVDKIFVATSIRENK